MEFSQQKTSFDARGENLRVVLNYNLINTSYQGKVAIDPLLLTSGNAAPLPVHVSLPLLIEGDAIRLQNGLLSTAASQILVNAGLRNLKDPNIFAHVNANVSLAELQKSFGLSIDTASQNVPHAVTADFQAEMEQNENIIHVQTAHLALGQTSFQASGTMQPGKNSAIQFNGDIALAELERLLKITTPSANGDLQLNGKATLDARSNYAVDGTLNSHALSISSGSERIPTVSLYSPFHVDPYLISLDGLKLGALGGGLAAKVFIENMQKLSVEGTLHDFSLPIIAGALTGKHLGYDGVISGTLAARGDMKAKGTTGYTAVSRLVVDPGRKRSTCKWRLERCLHRCLRISGSRQIVHRVA